MLVHHIDFVDELCQERQKKEKEKEETEKLEKREQAVVVKKKNEEWQKKIEERGYKGGAKENPVRKVLEPRPGENRPIISDDSYQSPQGSSYVVMYNALGWSFNKF